MRIYNHLEDFKAVRPVVTIGTFDGVHLGHRKVLDRLREIAREMEGETVIFTFYPHPRQVLTPEEKNLRLLTTLQEKTALLEKAGVDHLIIYPFTREFAALSYAEFVSTVLVGQMKTACLVVGYDHKFGRNREGDYQYLRKCAEDHQFIIEQLDVLLMNEAHISSTKIREALEAGDVKKANSYLGYSYELHGRVVEGVQLGRKIGFPTANIEASEVAKLIPGYGVYAVRVRLKDAEYKGMLNIGSRPTFNQNADNRSIEVHLFDFNDSLYGKELTLVFADKIREERKFSGIEELTRQLHHDKARAIEILNSDF